MLKHLLVGSLALSSLALARPPEPPRPPPPAAQLERRHDDTHALQFLRAFDAASARRDLRAMAAIDQQFRELLAREIRDARRDARFNPRARASLHELTGLERRLQRLPERGRGSILERRNLYAELVKVAERDGFGGRRA